MKKYIIDIEVPKVNNAGFKLRDDFNHFAAKCDYAPIKVGIPRYKNTLLNIIAIKLYSFRLFFKYLFVFKKGDMVLIQYPLNFKYIHAFFSIRRLIPVKIGILINDLDSLRHKSHTATEFNILGKLDYILSPNNKMSSFIKDHNVVTPIINIGMYDYKVERDGTIPSSFSESNCTVIFAGNLKQNKSGFIYELDKVASGNVHYNLYGDNYQGNNATSLRVQHKGTFAPDDIYQLVGDFGLVWDGPDTSTCSGNYGSYLKLNNPHKTSLYLTAGLPLITWDQSAVAEFITVNKTGICVADLKDLPEVLKSISEVDYIEMKKNTLRISSLLKNGHFLRKAIETSEDLFQDPKLVNLANLKLS